MKKILKLLYLVCTLIGCSNRHHKLLYTCKGKDYKVEFFSFYKNTIGGPRSAIVAKYNSKLIDYFGIYKDPEKTYEKIMPIQKKYTDRLSHRFKIEYESVPKDCLAWYIWVSPKQFTLNDFQNICHAVDSHKEELKQVLKNTGYLGDYHLCVKEIIYFNYNDFSSDTFEMQVTDELYKVVVYPQGIVILEVYNIPIRHRVGTAIGRVGKDGNSIDITNHFWNFSDFPSLDIVRKLKNRQGQTLEDCFNIEINENKIIKE